ncbi:MAG: hypothetical protein ABI134_03335 [Byssovorax sp.]
MSLAGGVRRTTGREVAEGAAELGSATTAEGAAEVGGAALALGSVLGTLEGDSVLPIDCKSPTMSVRGGGGGGG